jgi:hypothetical protein
MARGGKRPGAGRPAGSQNADTAAMRAALSSFNAPLHGLDDPMSLDNW